MFHFGGMKQLWDFLRRLAMMVTKSVVNVSDKDTSNTEKDKFQRQKLWGGEHGDSEDQVADLYCILKMIDWGRG